jgi:NAD(P)-dependent dehydrogenase (short-subunit alcohol dehydrogenase family)
VCRNEARGIQARDAIREATGNPEVELVLGDLSAQSGVRSAAAQLLERCERIDVLLNNAGAYFAERTLTEDGLERTFALNHMGYFLLVSLLRERLVASAPARIVNVASAAHRGGWIDFDDLQWENKRYKGLKAYCDSKMLNILFTQELSRRLEGTGVTANCLHPGAIRSGFAVHESSWFGGLVRLGSWFMLSPEQGAQTSIYLACSSEVEGVSGGYYAKKRPKRPMRKARNPKAAARLWEVSETLIR